jgi:catechol 2,3-dioxygenase-like lactoylglutathione lyase family enzyme
MALLKPLGGHRSSDPHRKWGSDEQPGCIIVFIEDPDGYKIELIERSA